MEKLCAQRIQLNYVAESWNMLAWKLTWQRLIQSKLLLQPANFVFKIRSWMSQFRISTYTRQPREPHNPRRDIHESSSTHVINGHKGSNCRTLHFIMMETLLKLICHIVVIHPCRLWSLGLSNLHVRTPQTQNYDQAKFLKFCWAHFQIIEPIFRTGGFSSWFTFFSRSIQLRVGCYRAIIDTSVADATDDRN